MPEYLTPGVYVEEYEIGAKPIEGVSTSTAAFLGEAERGPTTPKLVTSWLDYKRNFGSVFADGKFLPHAVAGFFSEGGARCYVARIAAKTAKAASLGLDGTGLTVTAAGPGAWGKNVFVKIRPASTPRDGAFKLSVHYWATPPDQLFDPELPANRTRTPRPSMSEVFDNLDVTPSSPHYIDKRINHGNSSLITVDLAPPLKVPAADAVDAAPKPLLGGDDGAAAVSLVDYEGAFDTSDKLQGLEALKGSNYDEVRIVYAPDASAIDGLPQRLITHCETMKYRFAILETGNGLGDPTKVAHDGLDSEFAALYYPWIQIIDPESGARVKVPPGGHVAGIYSRSDRERGYWKAPANETIRSAVDVEYDINFDQQGVLNPRGVNVIRRFPGRGIRVWGARTISSDPLWTYLNVRRIFIYLEASIFNATQWVVFEPNNEQLWARVRQTITQFLRAEWRSGAMMGLTEEDAFFVKCDRTTMTQNDIDTGRLIVMIGVAPVKPAEFVIFRLAQFTREAEA